MNRDYSSLLPKVLVRLFPEATVRQKVIEILGAYGQEGFHSEVERVHLGILKVSGVDLEMIKKNTKLACYDYRDLLVMSEYPLTFTNDQLEKKDPAKFAKLGQKEREQYDEWLARILAE